MVRGFIGFAAGVALFTVALPGTAHARTKTIYAGGPAAFQKSIQKHYGAGVNAFFAGNVTIHAGDSVRWEGMSIGFHTIDLPGKSTSDLPLFIPDLAHPLTGVKDAAGNPMWFNGQPTIGFNHTLLGPSGGSTYNGSKRVDSGLPGPKPASFVVRFTKVGSFRYFCDVHYGMEGTVKVLPAPAIVASTKQDAAAVASQEARATVAAARLVTSKPPAGTVQLGASAPGGLEVFAMFPSTLHVAVGATVTFAMSGHTREAHTASFGDTGKGGYLMNLSASLQSPMINPLALFPSDPPPMAVQVSPTSHGNGFASIGVLDADTATPNPSSAKVTFTTAGTYHYICLIHSFMHGTVVVG